MKKHTHKIQNTNGAGIVNQIDQTPGKNINNNVFQETVKLNSFVEFYDLYLKNSQRIKIVMPDSVDLTKKWISVFAPISVALLGHKKGDEVKLLTNGVERKIRVIEVSNNGV